MALKELNVAKTKITETYLRLQRGTDPTKMSDSEYNLALKEAFGLSFIGANVEGYEAVVVLVSSRQLQLGWSLLKRRSST